MGATGQELGSSIVILPPPHNPPKYASAAARQASIPGFSIELSWRVGVQRLEGCRTAGPHEQRSVAASRCTLETRTMTPRRAILEPLECRRLLADTAAAAVALPRPDHVVIVVEENHSYG